MAERERKRKGREKKRRYNVSKRDRRAHFKEMNAAEVYIVSAKATLVGTDTCCPHTAERGENVREERKRQAILDVKPVASKSFGISLFDFLLSFLSSFLFFHMLLIEIYKNIL